MPSAKSYDHLPVDQLASIIEGGETTFKHLDLSGEHFAQIALNHLQFIDCLFDQAALTQQELHAVRFERCSFHGTAFDQSHLAQCHFQDCALAEASFEQARFVETVFEHSRVAETHFAGAQFDATTIKNLLATDTTLRQITLEGVTLESLSVRARLVSCVLTQVTFQQVSFDSAVLIGCAFPLCTFQACTFQGTKVYEGKFGLAHFERCTLEGMAADTDTRFEAATVDVKTLESYLKTHDEVFGLKLDTGDTPVIGAQLGEATYIHCDFSHTRLENAWCYKARFFHCRFNATDWHNINLTLSQFHQCDLSGMHASKLRLYVALFHDCNFNEVDWHTLNIGKHMAFYECDCSGAKQNWHWGRGWSEGGGDPYIYHVNVFESHHEFDTQGFERIFKEVPDGWCGWHPRNPPDPKNEIFQPAQHEYGRWDARLSENCAHLLGANAPPRSLFKL